MRYSIFILIIAVAISAVADAQQNDETGRSGAAAGGKKEFPSHWGPPPQRQTRDLRQLPGGYGMGSGTLASWIAENMEADKKNPDRAEKEKVLSDGARIKKLEKEIAEMKDFMTRARFTKEGLADYKQKLRKKEVELAALKKKVSQPAEKKVPSFEEWVKGGKKIPEGMMFTGGTPWFDERTGKNRSPEEVYKMLFGRKPE